MNSLNTRTIYIDNNCEWNILDVIAHINCVLQLNCSIEADINCDGEVNIFDIVTLVNCVLADACHLLECP